MLLQITAQMESSGFVREPFGIQAPPYKIELGCDSDNRIVELRVQKTVTVSEMQLPTMAAPTPEGVINLDLPTDQPHFADLLDLVQYLESIGSFWFGFARILWAEAKYEWLPETDEERGILRVYSIKAANKYSETRRLVKPEVFANAIGARSRLAYLTIPMAFFREGVNDYRSFRYVNAFQNFYFFLEGLFGEGKFRSRHVERRFRSSPVLMDAIEKSMKRVDSPQYQRHRRSLETLLSTWKFDWTPREVIRMIVWMRGNLHHFSAKSRTPKGHPLNQREFESVAFLLQAVCHEVVGRIAR